MISLNVHTRGKSVTPRIRHIQEGFYTIEFKTADGDSIDIFLESLAQIAVIRDALSAELNEQLEVAYA